MHDHPETDPDRADTIRRIERERLRALVAADLAAADPLHADDFQLVTPRGTILTKADYLESIASGQITYRVFEPDSAIEVRLHDTAAVIRYRSRLEVGSGEDHMPPARSWHTDLYEIRDGRWQIVWSQATVIR